MSLETPIEKLFTLMSFLKTNDPVIFADKSYQLPDNSAGDFNGSIRFLMEDYYDESSDITYLKNKTYIGTFYDGYLDPWTQIELVFNDDQLKELNFDNPHYLQDLVDSKIKTKSFFKMVVDQIAYNTNDYNMLKNMFMDWYASYKTIIGEQKKITDANSLTPDSVDIALKSFGFYHGNKEDFFKNKDYAVAFLLSLCELYSIKGTPDSITRSLEFFGKTNSEIYEWWLVKQTNDEKTETIELPFQFSPTNSTANDSLLFFPYSTDNKDIDIMNFFSNSLLVKDLNGEYIDVDYSWVNYINIITRFYDYNFLKSAKFKIFFDIENIGKQRADYELYQKELISIDISNYDVSSNEEINYILFEYNQTFSENEIYIDNNIRYIDAYIPYYSDFENIEIIYSDDGREIFCDFIVDEYRQVAQIDVSSVPEDSYSGIMIRKKIYPTDESITFNSLMINMNQFSGTSDQQNPYYLTFANFQLNFEGRRTKANKQKNVEFVEKQVKPYNEFMNSLDKNGDPHWYYTKENLTQLILNTENSITLPSITPYFSISTNVNVNDVGYMYGTIDRLIKDQYQLFLRNGKDKFNQLPIKEIKMPGEIGKPRAALISLYCSIIYSYNRFNDFSNYNNLINYIIKNFKFDPRTIYKKSFKFYQHKPFQYESLLCWILDHCSSIKINPADFENYKRFWTPDSSVDLLYRKFISSESKLTQIRNNQLFLQKIYPDDKVPARHVSVTFNEQFINSEHIGIKNEERSPSDQLYFIIPQSKIENYSHIPSESAFWKDNVESIFKCYITRGIIEVENSASSLLDQYRSISNIEPNFPTYDTKLKWSFNHDEDIQKKYDGLNNEEITDKTGLQESINIIYNQLKHIEFETNNYSYADQKNNFNQHQFSTKDYYEKKRKEIVQNMKNFLMHHSETINKSFLKNSLDPERILKNSLSYTFISEETGKYEYLGVDDNLYQLIYSYGKDDPDNYARICEKLVDCLNVFILSDMNIYIDGFSSVPIDISANIALLPIINFFKPYRARLLSIDLIYQIQNKYFDSVNVGDYFNIASIMHKFEELNPRRHDVLIEEGRPVEPFRNYEKYLHTNERLEENISVSRLVNTFDYNIAPFYGENGKVFDDTIYEVKINQRTKYIRLPDDLIDKTINIDKLTDNKHSQIYINISGKEKKINLFKWKDNNQLIIDISDLEYTLYDEDQTAIIKFVDAYCHQSVFNINDITGRHEFDNLIATDDWNVIEHNMGYLKPNEIKAYRIDNVKMRPFDPTINSYVMVYRYIFTSSSLNKQNEIELVNVDPSAIIILNDRYGNDVTYDENIKIIKKNNKIYIKILKGVVSGVWTAKFYRYNIETDGQPEIKRRYAFSAANHVNGNITIPRSVFNTPQLPLIKLLDPNMNDITGDTLINITRNESDDSIIIFLPADRRTGTWYIEYYTMEVKSVLIQQNSQYFNSTKTKWTYPLELEQKSVMYIIQSPDYVIHNYNPAVRVSHLQDNLVAEFPVGLIASLPGNWRVCYYDVPLYNNNDEDEDDWYIQRQETLLDINSVELQYDYNRIFSKYSWSTAYVIKYDFFGSTYKRNKYIGETVNDQLKLSEIDNKEIQIKDKTNYINELIDQQNIINVSLQTANNEAADFQSEYNELQHDLISLKILSEMNFDPVRFEFIELRNNLRISEKKLQDENYKFEKAKRAKTNAQQNYDVALDIWEDKIVEVDPSVQPIYDNYINSYNYWLSIKDNPSISEADKMAAYNDYINKYQLWLNQLNSTKYVAEPPYRNFILAQKYNNDETNNLTNAQQNYDVVLSEYNLVKTDFEVIEAQYNDNKHYYDNYYYLLQESDILGKTLENSSNVSNALKQQYEELTILIKNETDILKQYTDELKIIVDAYNLTSNIPHTDKNYYYFDKFIPIQTINDVDCYIKIGNNKYKRNSENYIYRIYPSYKIVMDHHDQNFNAIEQEFFITNMQYKDNNNFDIARFEISSIHQLNDNSVDCILVDSLYTNYNTFIGKTFNYGSYIILDYLRQSDDFWTNALRITSLLNYRDIQTGNIVGHNEVIQPMDDSLTYLEFFQKTQDNTYICIQPAKFILENNEFRTMFDNEDGNYDSSRLNDIGYININPVDSGNFETTEVDSIDFENGVYKISDIDNGLLPFICCYEKNHANKYSLSLIPSEIRYNYVARQIIVDNIIIDQQDFTETHIVFDEQEITRKDVNYQLMKNFDVILFNDVLNKTVDFNNPEDKINFDIDEVINYIIEDGYIVLKYNFHHNLNSLVFCQLAIDNGKSYEIISNVDKIYSEDKNSIKLIFSYQNDEIKQLIYDIISYKMMIKSINSRLLNITNDIQYYNNKTADLNLKITQTDDQVLISNYQMRISVFQRKIVKLQQEMSEINSKNDIQKYQQLIENIRLVEIPKNIKKMKIIYVHPDKTDIVMNAQYINNSSYDIIGSGNKYHTKRSNNYNLNVFDINKTRPIWNDKLPRDYYPEEECLTT